MKEFLKYKQLDERIDDLQRNGLFILQKPHSFCFGVDAVLLSNFIEVKGDDFALEIGTGTGVISILLSTKFSGNITAFEIQDSIADMAKRSVKMNGLSNRINIVNADIRSYDFTEILTLNKIDLNKHSKNYFDVIFSNPPYTQPEKHLINDTANLSISRHEITLNLDDIFSIASKYLKNKGALYLVHRPNRLVDIFETARKYKIEPKLMRMVCPFPNKSPNIVLLKFVKNGGKDFKLLPNLYIYESEGVYSSEIDEIYGRK